MPLFETLPTELQMLIASLLETPTRNKSVSAFQHFSRFSLVSKQWTAKIKVIVKASLQNRRLGGFHLCAAGKGEPRTNCIAVVDLDTFDCLRYYSLQELENKIPSAFKLHFYAGTRKRSEVRRHLSASRQRLLVQTIDGPNSSQPSLLVCWRLSLPDSLDLALVYAGPIEHTTRFRLAAVSERGNTITIFYCDEDKEGYHEMTFLGPKEGFRTVHHKHLHDDTINSLVLSKRDERYLLAPADDRRVSILDRDANAIDYFEGHVSFVLGVDITEDERFVITSEFDSFVRIFDFASRQQLKVLQGFDTMVWHLGTVLQDNTLVLLAASEGRAIAWNLETFEKIFTINGTATAVMSLQPPLASGATRGVPSREEFLIVNSSGETNVTVGHLKHFHPEVTRLDTPQLIFEQFVPL